MWKAVLKGASVGLIFSAVALGAVKFLGFNYTSLSVLMYLYVAASVILFLRSEARSVLKDGILSSLVLVIEGEELKLRKLLTGETYRIQGELEKL